MNVDTFLQAVGEIDSRYLEIDKRPVIRHHWRRRIAAAGIAAALVLCPLPVMTAVGVDPAYNVLYQLAPDIAQTFKPVRKSCTDQGIEMTVISAEQDGSEASVCLAMRDLTGTCPEGDWDLFDSYDIRVPKDLTGHCSFSRYDADTHTAYFVVHLETMDGSDLPRGKVTFSVRELLQGKLRVAGEIPGIDMAHIPQDPETERRTEISGGGWGIAYTDLPDPADYQFLVPGEPLYTPIEGISIVGIGYVDGALHVLTERRDYFDTDGQALMELVDQQGNHVDEAHYVSFGYWDDSHTIAYDEYIFPVAYELLQDCRLNGIFWASKNHVSGNWQVTFPLE